MKYFTEKLELFSSTVTDSIGKEIVINSITNFNWDSLYVITPYTPKEVISSRFGFNPYDESYAEISSRDDINLLLFVKEKKVILTVEYPIDKGDFFEIKSPHGFSKNDAIFVLKMKKWGGHDKLVFYNKLFHISL